MIMASSKYVEEDAQAERKQFMLWIDGIGSYLVCLQNRVTIGGPCFGSSNQGQGVSDLTLLSSLSRKHASVVREGDGYVLEAHSTTKVLGRDVGERTLLSDNYEIELGGSVRLRFRLPSVLSSSARLEFLSDHRPPQSVDGVVLMDETGLLGPGSENHIHCHDWADTVLIFRKGDELWCKSRMDIFVGDQLVTKAARLQSGDTVNGPELRFRMEAT